MNYYIRCTKEMHKEVKMAAAAVGMSMQAFAARIWQEHKAAGDIAGSIPVPTKADVAKTHHEVVPLGPSDTPQESRWIQRLLKVLRSRHAVATRAITRNLVAFEELVDGATGSHTPPGALAEMQRDMDDFDRNAKAIGWDEGDAGTPGKAVGDPKRRPPGGTGTGGK